MVNKPVKTSTPNERIKGRRPIRDYSYSPSPIPQVSPSLKKKGVIGECALNEENLSGSSDIEEDDYIEEQEKFEQSATSSYWWCLFIISVLVILGACLYYVPEDVNDGSVSLSNLQLSVNPQDDDFIITLQVGVNDMLKYNQPTTFLFAYHEGRDDILKTDLKMIAKSILSQIEDKKNKEPIILDGASLNTPEFINDFGKIITKYKNKIEENVVMIVQNIENIKGPVAQVFHSFCDEYHPVVQKALFFLTVKIEKSYSNDVRKLVEIKLKESWSNLREDDKFYPLLARITSNVLLV